MRDFATFFCRKKKYFKIGFLNHGTAVNTRPPYSILLYIYIYIKERKVVTSIYTRFLSIFFFETKKGFYGTDSSISLNVSDIRHSSTAFEQGGTWCVKKEFIG